VTGSVPAIQLSKPCRTAKIRRACPIPPLNVLEMFRRGLPNGAARRRLNRLSNRLTKILSEARKLNSPEK
jgi:hypothetical protein